MTIDETDVMRLFDDDKWLKAALRRNDVRWGIAFFMMFMGLYTYLMLAVGFIYGGSVREQAMLDQLAMREMNITRLCYQPAVRRDFLQTSEYLQLGYVQE